MSITDFNFPNPPLKGTTVTTSNSFLGIASDYASNIPEPTSFSAEKLLKKLNEERFPWDKDKGSYSITQSSSWRWEIDFVQYAPTPYVLYRGEVMIASLEEEFVDEGRYIKPEFINLNLYGTATVDDIRFIKECTGWLISV